MQFSRVLRVRQSFPDRSLADIPGEVRRELVASGIGSKVRPGASVALGVGSRGIANIALITRAVVDFWKDQGAQPFIFPAMGSHGAATPEGQAKVLAEFGIDESTMGCPVRSQMAVVRTGKTAEGIETCVDKLAYDSDGIVLVGRVKWHTDFSGEIESGLLKMMAIGLGKFGGARHYHTHAYKIGMEATVLSAGRHILKTGKVLGGVAILEDACHRTGKVAALVAEKMETGERKLLALVKSWKGNIPVRAVDILTVSEMGKNISGTGMDTKVVNRRIDSPPNPWPELPRIERVFVRGMSALSYGSAIGIGMADVVTDRMVQQVRWEPTVVNALTSSVLGTAKLPMHFPSDRECLEKLAPSVGKFDMTAVTLAWIQDTLRLDRVVLSENLLPEIEKNPALEVIGAPEELAFDKNGNLKQLLAEEW